MVQTTFSVEQMRRALIQSCMVVVREVAIHPSVSQSVITQHATLGNRVILPGAHLALLMTNG